MTDNMQRNDVKAKKLSEIQRMSSAEIDSNDLFLVSDQASGDSKFVSKSLRYDDLKKSVTEDLSSEVKSTNAKLNDKRDLDFRRVCLRKSQQWKWSSDNCPADFLELANGDGAPILEYHANAHAWAGVVFYNLDGSLKYSQMPLEDAKFTGREVELKITFAVEGTKDTFSATAKRDTADDQRWIVADHDAIAFRSDLSRMYRDLSGKIPSAIVESDAKALPKYLHYLEFSDSYEEEAQLYYKERYEAQLAGCSSFRYGGFYGRNYDWNFDNSAEFIVSMRAGSGRHASVGVASLNTALTEETVTLGKPSPLYKVLPGMTLDGINEKGVVANINVVAADKRDENWKGTEINALGAVRFVLDRCDSAYDAAKRLADGVYIPVKFRAAGYSVHYMVADQNETYVVEDGQFRLMSPSDAVMTNYRVLSDSDPYGTGYERYDIMKKMMSGTGLDETAVKAVLRETWFTKAYEESTLPQRITEFASIGWHTHDDTEALTQYLNSTVIPSWKSKSREEHRSEKTAEGANKWWQTVHSSVYDFNSKTLKVAVQETDDWYSFSVPAAQSSGSGSTDEAKVREIVQSFKKYLPTRDISSKNAGIFSWSANLVQDSKAPTVETMMWNNIVLLVQNYENYSAFTDCWTAQTTITVPSKEGEVDETYVLKLQPKFSEETGNWEFVPSICNADGNQIASLPPFYSSIDEKCFASDEYDLDKLLGLTGYGKLKFEACIESELITEDGVLAKYSKYISDFAGPGIELVKQIIAAIEEMLSDSSARSKVDDYVYENAYGRWTAGGLPEHIILESSEPDRTESQFEWRATYADERDKYALVFISQTAQDDGEKNIKHEFECFDEKRSTVLRFAAVHTRDEGFKPVSTNDMLRKISDDAKYELMPTKEFMPMIDGSVRFVIDEVRPERTFLSEDKVEYGKYKYCTYLDSITLFGREKPVEKPVFVTDVLDEDVGDDVYMHYDGKEEIPELVGVNLHMKRIKLYEKARTGSSIAYTDYVDSAVSKKFQTMTEDQWSKLSASIPDDSTDLYFITD